jgi:leucyl/phenylalanyl-tRNA--protein transferase
MSTWITRDLLRAYVELHRSGHAHSVECWLDGELAGGLYGVAIGGLFAGESMFSRAANSSKVALVHLVDRLRERKYALLDIQQGTPHMLSMGGKLIPRSSYLNRLRAALERDCKFD